MRIFLRGYAFDPRLRRFSLCAFVIYFSPYTYSHVLVRAWGLDVRQWALRRLAIWLKPYWLLRNVPAPPHTRVCIAVRVDLFCKKACLGVWLSLIVFVAHDPAGVDYIRVHISRGMLHGYQGPHMAIEIRKLFADGFVFVIIRKLPPVYPPLQRSL